MKTSSFFLYTGPGRLSIARFAPRGSPAGYRIFKPLAPGSWFNSVDEATYRDLYFHEILGPSTRRRLATGSINSQGLPSPFSSAGSGCKRRESFAIDGWSQSGLPTRSASRCRNCRISDYNDSRAEPS
jgi:hypothetical protein